MEPLTWYSILSELSFFSIESELSRDSLQVPGPENHNIVKITKVFWSYLLSRQ